MCAVQKMEVVHRERVSHNTIQRHARTWWQDSLIQQITLMTISPYIDIRRTAQGILYVIFRRYKKGAPLILPTLLEALKDSDIDTVKGALHTLRTALLEYVLAKYPEYTEDYVVGLIHAFESFDRVSPLCIKPLLTF